MIRTHRRQRRLFILIAAFLFATTLIWFPASSVHAASMGICYSGYEQNTGWQNYTACNGKPTGDMPEYAGTIGQSLRLEATYLYLTNAPAGEGVCYQAYIQNIGWQHYSDGRPFYACDGNIVGTTNQSLRIEALSIWLYGTSSETVCYHGYVQNSGWQPYSICGGGVNGGPYREFIGTIGQSLRLEAYTAAICSWC